MQRQIFRTTQFWLLSALVSSAFLLAWPSRAQQASGVLTGVVKDPNGAVIPNAQITARNDATGETRNVSADGRGAFKFD